MRTTSPSTHSTPGVKWVAHTLLPALLLAGCATTEVVWHKNGASQQDFHADQGQCKAQALSVPGAMAPSMASQVVAVYSACMQGKGWYATERPSGSPVPAGGVIDTNPNYTVIR